MSDLIKREDALNAFGGDIVVINAKAVQRYIEGVMDRIKNLPSIDAVPAKHGRWQYIGGYGYKHRCSECIMCVERISKYCPHCGARMDGEDNG